MPPAAPVRVARWSARARAAVLAALLLALHAGELARPFPDGAAGNCGGMFGIVARNSRALGWPDGLLPTLNPVPPASLGEALPYSHHPPGLPWLATLAGTHAGLPFETGARLAALLLSWAAAVLAALLAARLAGETAGWIAGLLMVGLPAGWHHGALVNYETAAIPAALWLHGVLADRAEAAARRRPPTRAAAAGLLAGLADWIALWPLLTRLRRADRRTWLAAAAGAAVAGAGSVALYRGASPGSPGAALAQALGASPLAADFEPGAWAAALARHMIALYGPGLLGIAAVVWTWRRQTPAARASLTGLATLGAANVILFARHATGHEHFSLLLLPFVAVGSALALTTLAPGPRRRALAAGATAALLIAAGLQALADRGDRQATHEAQLAARFAAATDPGTIYVRPEGASFVFLHGARRHVVPFPAGDPAEVRERIADYRRRFGGGARPARLVLAPGVEPPPALAGLPAAGERDGFRFFALPD